MRVLWFALLASLPLRAQEPRPTVVLHGQVVDQRGEPVPLARVVVHDGSENVLGEGVAEAEGRFRIANVARSASYFVTAAGERFAGDAWTDRADIHLHLTGHETACVRGTVRDRDGKPVAKAMVQAAARLAQRDLLTHATTDTDGRFELRAVTLGYVRIAAVVPGHGLAQEWRVIGDDAEVALAPGKEVTTSVQVEVHGLPADALAKARVQLIPDPETFRPLPPPWSAMPLDATGRCEVIQLPALRYSVRVAAPGFAFAPRRGAILALEGAQRVEFSAVELGTSDLQCPARLVDAAGKPLGGVRLRLEAGDGSTEAVTDTSGRATFASPAPPHTPAVVTAVDDVWVLECPRDPAMLPPGIRLAHSTTIDAATTIELRAVPSCHVAGRLWLPGDKPAAYVQVGLQREQGHVGWMTFEPTVTDADGRFRFAPLHHSQLPVRVAVTAWVGNTHGEPLSIDRPGSRITVPDLELSPPATIEGVVRDAAGNPAGGIRIRLTDETSVKSLENLEVVTDRQGRYRVLGVPAGTVHVQPVAGGAHPPHPMVVAAGTTYTLDLKLAR